MARILLCDDDPTIRSFLSGVLLIAGHEVKMTFSAEHATKAARSFEPEVLLISWMEGGLSSLEVVEILQGSRPELQTVLYSEMPRTARILCEEAGLSVFKIVPTPRSPELILQLVDEAFVAH